MWYEKVFVVGRGGCKNGLFDVLIGQGGGVEGVEICVIQKLGCKIGGQLWYCCFDYQIDIVGQCGFGIICQQCVGQIQCCKFLVVVCQNKVDLYIWVGLQMLDDCLFDGVLFDDFDFYVW